MSSAAKQMAALRAPVPRGRPVRKRADKSSTHNFIGSLPHGILMKILSYLDAPALFSISHSDKLFFELASEKALWKKIYMAEFGKHKLRKPSCMDASMLKMEEQDHAAGYWKWCYFKAAVADDTRRWKHRLCTSISCHTGLPSRTKQVLRNLSVTWELTITDKSGHESTLELSWSQFCEPSLTLCWGGGGDLPDYEQISTLQLHGIRRNALNCPGLMKRSLMVKLDMQSLTVRTQVTGQDRLVQLKLLQPGIIIGVWRDQPSVAFLMFTLHFHRLVERSLQGTCVQLYEEPVPEAPFDDIDSEYGLHGYKLHVVLHDAACRFMSGNFSKLFCPRAQISDGLIQLTAISRTDLSQHTPLEGRISLSWRSEALQGAIENCCIMTLTLLDEYTKPFKCVSSPVSMEPEKTEVFYDYDGEHYLIYYQDSDVQVKMQLVRMEKENQFILISLVLYLSVCSVNKHFGRNY